MNNKRTAMIEAVQILEELADIYDDEIETVPHDRFLIRKALENKKLGIKAVIELLGFETE